MEDSKVKKLASSFVRGFILNNLPGIIKGMINEFLKKATVDTIVQMVNSNESLWKRAGPKYYEKIQNVVLKAGDVSWLTADWLIDSMRVEHPAIASLFLGWKKSYNWLERQVKEIKESVEELKKTPVA